MFLMYASHFEKRHLKTYLDQANHELSEFCEEGSNISDIAIQIVVTMVTKSIEIRAGESYLSPQLYVVSSSVIHLHKYGQLNATMTLKVRGQGNFTTAKVISQKCPIYKPTCDKIGCADKPIYQRKLQKFQQIE